MTNKIISGDCIGLMKTMADNSVEMTLTDIPYGVINRSSNGLRDLDKQAADTETFDLEVFLKDVIRVTKGSIYVFCSTEQVSFLRAEMVSAKLSTRLCIWEKANPSPMNGQYIWLSGVECCVYGKKKKAVFNEHCKNTVWKYPVVRNQQHPTQKPLELFQYLVRVSSNVGDIVFDPCAGSGTTAVAALKENRKYIIADMNPDYVDIAQQRVLELTSINT
jgi:DNA modification methylase